MSKKKSRKIIDYVIVSGRDDHYIQSHVVELLRSGYELYGGLCFGYHSYESFKYQVLVKYSK